jgi:ferredoxin
MSRVEVDRDRCLGTGTCEMIAPEVFEVGDDGVVAVVRPVPAGDGAVAVEEAVQACPVQALTLAD